MNKIILFTCFILTFPALSREDVCSIPVESLLAKVKVDGHFDEQIPSQYLMIKSFVALKICAPIRWNEYIEHLPGSSQEDAIILLYASQSLKGKTYLDFGKSLLNIVNDKEVPVHFLTLFLFPGYDWNTEFIENYKDPKVVSFLNNSKVLLVQEKDRVEEIILGKSLKSLINSRLHQRVPINTL